MTLFTTLHSSFLGRYNPKKFFQSMHPLVNLMAILFEIKKAIIIQKSKNKCPPYNMLRSRDSSFQANLLCQPSFPRLFTLLVRWTHSHELVSE